MAAQVHPTQTTESAETLVGQGFLENLPHDVLSRVVAVADRESWTVLSHVSRALLAAVRQAEEAASARTPVRLEYVCCAPELVRWATQQGCPWGRNSFRKGIELAAKRGDLGVLKALLEAGCPMDDVAVFAVAGSERVEVLEWAEDVGLKWKCPAFCWAAARNGSVELLKAARRYDCPWDWRTASAAAFNNHLPLLKWLHEQGCPWDETTCAAAASCGNLEMLRYLQSQDCPWDERTLTAAEAKGHEEVVEWSLAHGCPAPQTL